MDTYDGSKIDLNNKTYLQPHGKSSLEKTNEAKIKFIQRSYRKLFSVSFLKTMFTLFKDFSFRVEEDLQFHPRLYQSILTNSCVPPISIQKWRNLCDLTC